MFQIHNKRGIGITFNWVFAVIAGAIIFMFFVGFAAENMDLFGKLTAMRVSEELNTAFSGLKTTLVSTSISFDRDINLEFKCIDGKKEKLIVGWRSGRNLYDNLVFSPEEMEGSEFLLMTKSWKVPYRVDNFIFISDNRNYCLEDPPADFGKDLPDDFKGLLNNDDDCEGKKIIFNLNLNPCDTFNKEEININYKEDSVGNFYGTICGKNEDRTWGPLNFYGDAMIYAAIFGDQFSCLYPLIEEKLRIMSDVYVNKATRVGANDIANNIRNLKTIEKIDYTYYETVETQNKNLIGEEGNAVF